VHEPFGREAGRLTVYARTQGGVSSLHRCDGQGANDKAIRITRNCFSKLLQSPILPILRRVSPSQLSAEAVTVKEVVPEIVPDAA